MTSLSEAKIHLNGYRHDCGIDCTKCGCSIAFLSSLCHVKYLKISECSFEPKIVDISGMGSMEKFVNLTKLELDLIIDWRHVVMFLDVADNLEVLRFKPAWVPYMEPKRVSASMLSSLKAVTIVRFGCHEEGCFDMVRYILRNAKVLERMEIHHYGRSSDEEKLDVRRRISLFERGSESCQLTSAK